MINIHANKQLDIILPNTNKALKEVLKGATPKELEVLTKSKDLKSVLNSILKGTSQSSASDKILLQLIKNNPTLKDLGNVSSTIKDLLNSMQTKHEATPVEKILNKFVSDLNKLSKETTNKTQNTQSNVQTPQTKLNDTLKSLQVIVEKSPSFPIRSLSSEIKQMLNNEVLKNPASPTNPPTTQSLAQLSKTIESVVRGLQSNINDVDPKALKELVNNLPTDKTKSALPIEKVLKEFLGDIKQLSSEGSLKSKITDSGVFLESKLKNAQNPQVELRDTLKSLQVLVEKSSIYPVKSLDKHIQTLLNNETVKNASNNTLAQPLADDKKAITQVLKGVEKIVETLQSNLKEGDATTTKTFNTLIEKLQHQMQPKLMTPENFKLSSVQETMQQLLPQLSQSTLPEAKGLLDALVKILKITPTTPVTQLSQNKDIQTMQSSLQTLKGAMSKADPLFSKEVGLLLNKLSSLGNAQNLSNSQNIKDIISNDLKSLLLKTANEIANSSHPNQAEILKHTDKLLLQIDYYQLMSHLSNSSSLYLPFSWDSLEEGNINLKKGEDEKFYCDIELKLKEYGELSLRLVLYEENQLNIKILSDNDEFKKIIKENIASLRSALIESNITPREIRLQDATKEIPTSAYENSDENINVGFEIKA